MPTLPTRMRPIFLALLAGFILGAQDADLAEKLFLSGERAYTAKAYSEALETWSQLLQQAPKSPFAAQALWRMARHQLDVEKKPEAGMPFLEKLKAEHIKTPWAAEAMLQRGVLLAGKARKLPELKEAVAEFNRVVDLFPEHPALQGAQFQLGLAARRQGQWGRSLQHFTEVLRLDPATALAPKALLQMAEIRDIQGELNACLRLLQAVRTQHPGTPEANEAAWRISVRLKHRIQRPPLKSEGPWPAGKVKWLKSPILLAMGQDGELFVFQDDLDRAFLLKDGNPVGVGAVAKNAKAMTLGPNGQPWLVSSKAGLVKDDGAATLLPNLGTPTGAFLDAWENLWVSDAKAGGITVVAADGNIRSIPSPSAAGMAPLPGGGAVLASDANRELLFLDATGATRLKLVYGKELPAPFKYVIALGTDALGHVAALVDGDFEGVVLWGPDGTLLRFATYKSLGISGKFRAVLPDRQGGLLLADKSNDLLIRLD